MIHKKEIIITRITIGILSLVCFVGTMVQFSELIDSYLSLKKSFSDVGGNPAGAVIQQTALRNARTNLFYFFCASFPILLLSISCFLSAYQIYKTEHDTAFRELSVTHIKSEKKPLTIKTSSENRFLDSSLNKKGFEQDFTNTELFIENLRKNIENYKEKKQHSTDEKEREELEKRIQNCAIKIKELQKKNSNSNSL